MDLGSPRTPISMKRTGSTSGPRKTRNSSQRRKDIALKKGVTPQRLITTFIKRKGGEDGGESNEMSGNEIAGISQLQTSKRS